MARAQGENLKRVAAGKTADRLEAASIKAAGFKHQESKGGYHILLSQSGCLSLPLLVFPFLFFFFWLILLVLPPSVLFCLSILHILFRCFCLSGICQIVKQIFSCELLKEIV